MDQSVLSYCVIYRMDQPVPNSVFFKSVVTGLNTVAMGLGYYSSIAIDVDDVIMLVANILL